MKVIISTSSPRGGMAASTALGMLMAALFTSPGKIFSIQSIASFFKTSLNPTKSFDASSIIMAAICRRTGLFFSRRSRSCSGVKLLTLVFKIMFNALTRNMENTFCSGWLSKIIDALILAAFISALIKAM